MDLSQNSKNKIGGWYAHYVLAVLVIVYVFNFIDRQILSILAEDIRADLGVSDAQLGFLYGTVFAIFYAVFGIPLARFADVWVRKSVISVGLLFWSVMTFMSGLARSFPMLALFRIGVGIGEASASPATYSMLSDYYSPRLKAMDLVMPRMRAIAGAYYLLINTFIGLALGPYCVGLLSDNFAANGMDSAEALRSAISYSMLIFIVTLVSLSLAWRYLPKEESTRLDRARSLGEKIAEAT